MWLSVDPLVEQTMDAYGYCYQNPINLIDPDGKAGKDPIILSNFSKGVNSVGFNIKNYRLIAPNNSFTGSTKTISAMKDQVKANNNFIGKLLGVSGPEFIRSVSISNSKTTGQYYNQKGEKVDDIKDASKLIVSTYTKKETVNLNGSKVDKNGVLIYETMVTTTYSVNKNENNALDFVNTIDSQVIKNKSYKTASDEIQNLATTKANENKELMDSSLKKNEVRNYNEQTQLIDGDRNREKNMGNASKYTPPPTTKN
jgi:hypothetical protein